MATTHNASVIESICSGQPQLSNATVYLAAVLNLTAPTDFVLGDGSRGQGQHNAALRPGCDYTALLRLTRLSPQVPIAGAPALWACCRPRLGPSLPLGCLPGHAPLPFLGGMLSLRSWAAARWLWLGAFASR